MGATESLFSFLRLYQPPPPLPLEIREARSSVPGVWEADVNAPITIVQGHVEAHSGVKCGWANGYADCEVPDCKFPSERCLCVQREHDRGATLDA